MISEKYLYEKSKLIKESYLEVDNHKVYYQLRGNINGKAMFIVHGGPGGGNNEKSTRFFDPNKFLFILIDQRGCGKSTPWLEKENNTIENLANDIEAIRIKENLNKIILFGGSWGTTLSLYYAIKYPQNLERMLLRGIFLARKFDLEWFCKQASYLKPLEYQQFLKPLKNKENIIEEYYEIFNSNDQLAIENAALSWANWENCLISVNNIQPVKKISETNRQSLIQIAFFENFYFKNDCFMQENYILDHLDNIKNLPIDIVHGEYDIDCLPIGAYQLHKKLNNSNLYLIKKAAHTQWESNIAKKLIEIGKTL